MTTATTTDTTATAQELVKLVWLPVLFVNKEKVTNHLCYRTSPAIEFAPHSADPDDARPHAMVPALFAEYLVETAMDPATLEPVYAYAEDVAPARPAARQNRRIGAGRQ